MQKEAIMADTSFIKFFVRALVIGALAFLLIYFVFTDYSQKYFGTSYASQRSAKAYESAVLKAVDEMRSQGVSEADIKAYLGKLNVDPKSQDAVSQVQFNLSGLSGEVIGSIIESVKSKAGL